MATPHQTIHTVITILAGFFLAWGIVSLLQVLWNKPPTLFAQNQSVEIFVEGFRQTCGSPMRIYQKISGSWKDVTTILPAKGKYFLDGDFVGGGMCDVSTCNAITEPIAIPLLTYRHKGSQTPPSESGVSEKAPVFHSTPLAGDIKIEMEYFSDSACRNARVFSQEMTR